MKVSVQHNGTGWDEVRVGHVSPTGLGSSLVKVTQVNAQSQHKIYVKNFTGT